MIDIFDTIKVDKNSRVPKYKQIVDSIIHNISIGNLNMGQKIPSINRLSEEFVLSRDTVEKAYTILKEKKVISPIRGKGYYITRTKLLSKINVLFLINKLSNYKMRIYNSFVKNIKEDVHTDLHIYHCNESVFLNLLDKNIGAYDYYIIMPHFSSEDSKKHISSTNEVIKAIKKIPKEKLLILDNKVDLGEGIIQIYQDFENDIYHALKKGIDKILAYKKLIFIYPENVVHPYPKKTLHGFRKFCVEYVLDFEILNGIYEDTIIKKGDLFITIEESDLVNLVHHARDRNFTLGKDIGIISYNETPLKELLDITVISTGFNMMGKTAAKMILEKKKGEIKNPFDFIDRGSL